VTASFPSAEQLTRLRADLPESLVPVDDRRAWTLYAEDPNGFRHVWEHRRSGWLSQSLTVPEDCRTPEGAAAHRQLEMAAETRARAAEREAEALLGTLRSERRPAAKGKR
jgi:hypothetical protein